MIEASDIRDKLRADADVLAVVDSYSGSSAIFGQPVMPDDFAGTGISMYRSSPLSARTEFLSDTITINCYSKDRSKAVELQVKVKDALNRKADGTETFYVCSLIPVIASGDSRDDYNAPVEVIKRQRQP